nr:MAG TPA: hypothetical protein [Caudoviricetes sp.]
MLNQRFQGLHVAKKTCNLRVTTCGKRLHVDTENP